jgi:hypothetical protein
VLKSHLEGPDFKTQYPPSKKKKKKIKKKNKKTPGFMATVLDLPGGLSSGWC